ncbi:nickel pincer cofactor biosynthesis protein LarC [Nocardia asteroides]|uniref:nickel pincer cofactor biosynthesis protein LarC n=1 Tax=Nocardia asteroides TaxID=1824 RepID=UPI001E2A349B|nr:nickel pincer cofactor biosynthesis protein LarC [Nocardia asteroides]UGT55108.1 nickel pincer cofactor biosynthesis protein LarC [Nocardia asteroides]
MNHLYIDCVGGVAGDMLLASLIDAGASLDAVQAGLPLDCIDLEIQKVERHGVGALGLTVHGGHDHAHRTWQDVRVLIDSGSMPTRARQRAHAAFALLAEAEGHVHGVPPEEVTFHEVGALDAIADICGVALALEDLGIDEVTCSPLPLGRGITRGSHGLLPLPAPATVQLLRNADVYGAPADGETVTPTGAALVASLTTAFGPLPSMTLKAVGVGAGTWDPEQFPNVVRSMIGTAPLSTAQHSGPLILETNVDDLSPELVPDVIEACLDAGAADVWTTPALMKHGRPGFTVAALVQPQYEKAVAEALLQHSTALGVRVRRSEHRWQLVREFRPVQVDGHEIAVKFGLLNGRVVNIKPEHRDCVSAAKATGKTVKAIWAAALTQAHKEYSDGTLYDSELQPIT